MFHYFDLESNALLGNEIGDTENIGYLTADTGLPQISVIWIIFKREVSTLCLHNKRG